MFATQFGMIDALPVTPGAMLGGIGDEGVAAVALFGGLFSFLCVQLVFDSMRRAKQTAEREQTRREVAAYVAEGSMTPDEGERLLRAGEPDDAEAPTRSRCGRR